ncbi:MAG: nucleotidyltransferase domain-containing protein [Acidobacteria bacterium]|nr:nucleotidyltransferase domain-containing protein [Acidobacteriota bacterium]
MEHDEPNAPTRHGAGRLLFGSAARGEMRTASDVDLLVEFLPNAKVDLVEYAGLILDLSKLFGRADIVGDRRLRRPGMLPEFRYCLGASLAQRKPIKGSFHRSGTL